MNSPKVFGDQNITIAIASNGVMDLFAGQNKIGFISRVVLDTASPFTLEVHFPRGTTPEQELQIEAFARSLALFPMVRIIRE